MQNERLSIYTLGNFKVLNGGDNLTNGKKKMSKRWQLLQYLITFRKRDVAREELIMNLGLNENQDPEGSLSALIYRLRKVLNSSGRNLDFIKTTGTAYTFNTETDYWLDIEKFENHCQQAKEMIEGDFQNAISNFENAIEIYEGEYLEDANSKEWIWSVRNKYRDLLVSTMLELDQYFEKKNSYNKLWQLYNLVQQRINFDERIIKGAIEALIKDERWGMARFKYQEVLSLYQENDLLIPPELKALESKLGNMDDDPESLVEYFQRDNEVEGAFICNDRETFSTIYELEKRRLQRNTSERYLAHLRLTGKLEREKIIMCGDKMLKLLSDQLRSGDVVCRWNSKHFIILMTDVLEGEAERILKRLKNSFMAKFELPEELILEQKGYQL
ncbi:DNA-binding SARP family transcriptional activator [Halanaerobium saccharolyticum]|uniref:DNA-binding SARP family transcriptional activator n=1 Tax=Halanaerobium saccharolyticum TaxID=43595 RepID=A0A4R6LL62_9FIRM|nr:BTAD domain-containing putative transcriptional regulator [Halanaerobium saccharolyticum]TDO85874.1 DNA-binding SARP family transcriptional activator [Halanaerobium saccharolyticum]